MSERETRIIVPVLARVEGEGALTLHVRDQKIERLELRIYEPPRLFEKFLEGRDYQEVPDMVARICGICPVAYQMSAVRALEQAFGVDAGEKVRDLRRLFYCGEWIQSHSLHIHLLAAPDFLGFDSAPAMARRFPDEIRRGLRLQALGNDIIRLLGARSVHPVGARVGGFYRIPTPAEAQALRERLAAAQEDARALVRWTAGLELAADEQEFTTVALRHADEYPMNEGRIVSSDALDIPVEEYERHFREFQVPWSTALHSLLHEKPYLVAEPQHVSQHRRARGGNLLRTAGGHPPAGAGRRDGLRRAADRTPGRDGIRLHRGAARTALAPLHNRRAGTDRFCPHRSAHQPEPGAHRSGSSGLARVAWPCASGGGTAAPRRDGHQELRPVHLLRHAFPQAAG